MTMQSGKTVLNIVKDEMAMGSEAAVLAMKSLKEASLAGKRTVLWMMAAPTGFTFYKSFVELAAQDKDFRQVLSATEFFQFDDYPVARSDHRFPITFRHLLETYFFGPLEKIVGRLPGKHLLEMTGTDSDARVIATYEEALKNRLADAGTYVLEIKGIGMDGHWGFHGSETPLQDPPRMMQVPMNRLNIQQQMLDWPQYFPNAEAVPREAVTANVALFMQSDRVIDLVPQEGKAFAVLATYGPKGISPLVPSSKLKDHPDSHAFLTEKASWALREYVSGGKLTDEMVARLKGIWKNDANQELQRHNEHLMVEILLHVFG